MSSSSAITLDYHAGMLADRARVDAFRRAIEEVVREGDVVIDVGTGTGLLAALCARAGAARVYALEVGEIAGLAADLIAANGLDHIVEVVPMHSAVWTPPERADVLVSETLWNFGYGEGLVEIIRDMRNRGLVPKPRLIPSSFDILVAPVSDEKLWEAVGAWTGSVAGYALDGGREFAGNGIFIRDIDPKRMLGAGSCVGQVDLAAEEVAAGGTGRATWKLDADTTIHGLAGWFDAVLAPNVRLNNQPGERMSWGRVFLPIDPPLEVQAGQEVHVELLSMADGRELRWTVRVGDDARAHSTFRGRLLGGSWIRRRSPSATLDLSALGRATVAALAFIESGGTIGELHAMLEGQFADVLHSPIAREEFVSNLAAGFCV